MVVFMGKAAVSVDMGSNIVADLAVEPPTKSALAVDLETTRALGVTIPQSVLLQASRVIE
jgi:hypothetical protein